MVSAGAPLRTGGMVFSAFSETGNIPFDFPDGPPRPDDPAGSAVKQDWVGDDPWFRQRLWTAFYEGDYKSHRKEGW